MEEQRRLSEESSAKYAGGLKSVEETGRKK